MLSAATARAALLLYPDGQSISYQFVQNGVLWAKFWETVQNLCVIIQLEPTVKKTVEPLVMGDSFSLVGVYVGV